VKEKMDNLVANKQNYSKVGGYIQNDALNLSPTEVILKIYDFVILSLKKGDTQRAMRGITELIVSLNFDYEEFSMGMYKLYQYSRDQIIHGNTKEALVIIEGLRESWVKAFNL
jgi:flagellin-specific chaperone FliS